MNYLNEIITFLKSQRNFNVNWTDSPYQQFAAEYQDWSFASKGSALLCIGYWFEQNGDMVPDPNINIELKNDVVVSAMITTCMSTRHKDDNYVNEFLSLVWERHFQKRLVATA